MPDIDVRAYIDQLRRALPHVPPIDARQLKSLHRQRDYEGMVRLIKSAMNLDARLRIGWVNSGGPEAMKEAPAWVRMPAEVPYYGTTAFKNLTLTMYLRKSFLEQNGYGQTAIVIAHELSHVVLDSIRHPLRKEEKAVDLTAMLLGFSHLYGSAAHTERRSGNIISWQQLGYLSPEELRTADRILTPRPLRAKRTLLATARQFVGIILIVGGVAAWWSASAIYEKWQLHQIVLTEQAEYQKHLPITLTRYVTLIDTKAGFTSFTRVFRLGTIPPNFDLSAFQAGHRKSVCELEAAHIRRGVTYVSEHLNAKDELVSKIVIESCP